VDYLAQHDTPISDLPAIIDAPLGDGSVAEVAESPETEELTESPEVEADVLDTLVEGDSGPNPSAITLTSPRVLEGFALDSVAIWGGPISGADQASFDFPSGIALSPSEGEVYVYDGGNERIKAYSVDGQLLRVWPHPSGLCGTHQSSIAVAQDGTLFVADEKTHGVIGYSPSGAILARWSIPNASSLCDLPGHAHGLSIMSDGTLAFTEIVSRQILFFSLDGTLRRTTGMGAQSDELFIAGPGIVVESQRQVYATDLTRIAVFDSSGVLRRFIVGPKSSPFHYLQTGAATIGDWVAFIRADEPPGFYAIRPGSLTVTHQWVARNGHGAGELLNPWAVAIAKSGRWYVSEAYGHRIQVFVSTFD